MAYFMRPFLFFVLIGIIQGFLFDQMSDGHKCSGVSMLCPPMCRKTDSSGCVSCDCAHINPAMPMDPSNIHMNPGNPSSNTGGGFPGSTSCNMNWLNCACTPSVDAASGCLLCQCGQNNPQTSPAATNAPNTTPKQGQQTSHVTSNQVSTRVPAISSSSAPVVKTTKSMVTTPKPTVVSTKLPAMTTKITFNTNLPIIATTPAPSAATSLPPTTTTQPAFLCPGIFNCSLDCYAGFEMDSNGCPKCQCAPIPTDLP